MNYRRRWFSPVIRNVVEYVDHPAGDGTIMVFFEFSLTDRARRGDRKFATVPQDTDLLMTVRVGGFHESFPVQHGEGAGTKAWRTKPNPSPKTLYYPSVPSLAWASSRLPLSRNEHQEGAQLVKFRTYFEADLQDHQIALLESVPDPGWQKTLD